MWHLQKLFSLTSDFLVNFLLLCHTWHLLIVKFVIVCIFCLTQLLLPIFSEAKIWRNKILKILKTLHIDILASGLSEVCLFPYLLICQLPSVPVGKPVESLPVLSCWWFRVFQDALVGVTSQASCHQPSKSTAVLRLLWWDGEEKWVSVWGEISCGALETCFLCHLGHIQHVLDSNYTCIHSPFMVIFNFWWCNIFWQ